MEVSADEGRNLQKPLTGNERMDDDIILMTLNKEVLVLTVDH